MQNDKKSTLLEKLAIELAKGLKEDDIDKSESQD